jgi:hypothetical protein
MRDKQGLPGDRQRPSMPLYKMPIFIKKGAKVLKSFADLQKLYDESLAIAKNKPDLKELEKKAVW